MTKWIMDLISSTGYFGIILLMFVENVFPPIPSEYIMPLAGFMASKDIFTLTGIIVAGTVGSVLGALPLYFWGRHFGEERLKDFAGEHGRWLTLSRRDIERADKWFREHGGRAVLFGRLVPGFRSLISIPAGINRMGFFKFLLFTALGAGAWTALLAYAGFFLGKNFRRIEDYLDVFSLLVLGLVVAVYLWRVFFKKK